nr:ParB N-terminal domain-containing protein [Candidatus Njordarchaeum guaymaensis]
MNKSYPPMLDIGCLRPHEQVDPLRLKELEKQLAKDGFQKDPIIVDEKNLIVIDGHHRILALKALGYSKVVAHKIKYKDDDRIVLRTWYPVIKGHRKELLEILRNHVETSGSETCNQNSPTLVLSDCQYSLKSDRKTIMNCLLGRFKIEYVPDEETARRLVKNGKHAGAILFDSIGKEDVVKAALSGEILPPKTTQHIVPDKPMDWFIPLRVLGNGFEIENPRKE